MLTFSTWGEGGVGVRVAPPTSSVKLLSLQGEESFSGPDFLQASSSSSSSSSSPPPPRPPPSSPSSPSFPSSPSSSSSTTTTTTTTTSCSFFFACRRGMLVAVSRHGQRVTLMKLGKRVSFPNPAQCPTCGRPFPDARQLALHRDLSLCGKTGDDGTDITLGWNATLGQSEPMESEMEEEF
eukprot:g10579.t1